MKAGSITTPMTGRPKTDDEMEAAGQRWLDPRQDKYTGAEISRGDGGSSDIERQLDAVLDDDAHATDERLHEELNELGTGTHEESTSLKMRRLIADASQKYGPGGPIWEANRPGVREKGARKSRERYAEEKGAPVRPYRRGLSAPTAEQRKAEEATAARERYAKKVAEFEGRGVSRYKERMDLSGMNPEERAAYKREQNKIRQQLRRSKTHAK
ncbi:hypothetical protein NKJ10_00165 [Mesorhizobium sp. M0204]|uniref:hypothetical protein n=1 Tax=Mesorhizobium sp. M0204 TaxID=2956913 RepID=UPI003335E894